MKKENGGRTDLRRLILLALFAAIIIVMANIPFLGYIPLGFMNATTVHIPVIIGACAAISEQTGDLQSRILMGLRSIRSQQVPQSSSKLAEKNSLSALR